MSDLFQNRSDIFFATPNSYDFQRETFQTKSDTQKNRHAGHLPPGVPRTTNQSRYSSWGGFFIASRKPATCECSRSRPLGGRFHFGTDSLVMISEHCFYFTVSNIFHADIVVGNALAATSGNALHHCNSDFVMQIKQNNLKQECFSTKFYKIIYFSAKHALHFRAQTDSCAANAYRQACFFPPECKVHYTIKTYLRKKTNKTTQQCTTKT